MAKVAEQYVILKISKLVSDKEDDSLEVVNDEMAGQLVEVLETLLDNESFVVEKADAE